MPETRGDLGLSVLGVRTFWLLVWAVLVSTVSTVYLLPAAKPPSAHSADKILHLLAFTAVGFPLWLACGRAHILASLIFLNMIWAVALEIVQQALPGREFSLLDIGANFAGIAFGAAIGLIADLAFHSSRSWPVRRSAKD